MNLRLSIADLKKKKAMHELEEIALWDLITPTSGEEWNEEILKNIDQTKFKIAITTTAIEKLEDGVKELSEQTQRDSH